MGGLSHDGPAGESLANKAFILVKDCTYGKHDRFDKLNKQKQYFVICLEATIEVSDIDRIKFRYFSRF
ncbi:hypothetical protein [Sporosarcina limicola]|uniref:Uncharacterized protein n=1 Tax=Sporosarcina limicola TaxID=34101 RepID=A0A927ML73_9BACL|nr:hypothetical protein [Sporosarcina limicola]MBE1555988.1 hypothetical protein [Sporosarcina limicola]